MDITTVKLGEHELTLKLPESYSLRWEIWTSATTNRNRAWAAALGVCIPEGAWPIKEKGANGKPKHERQVRPFYAYDVLAYGGEVIDALQKGGFKVMDVMTAGVVAYSFVASSVYSEPEVAAAADFSQAPPAVEGEQPAK